MLAVLVSTLSICQVSYARAVSKLKLVKTRLRASLGNDKLETFMLMSTEKDILQSINIDDVMSVITEDSSVYPMAS